MIMSVHFWTSPDVVGKQMYVAAYPNPLRKIRRAFEKSSHKGNRRGTTKLRQPHKRHKVQSFTSYKYFFLSWSKTCSGTHALPQTQGGLYPDDLENTVRRLSRILAH